MVRRVTCPKCNGNKYVAVPSDTGRTKHTQCPGCGGNGYHIRVDLHAK